MALILTYEDLFPGSTSMRQYAGNGSISIPSSGDARFMCPMYQSCAFYRGAADAPLLYEQLSKYQTGPKVFYIETKLSYLTGTVVNVMGGLTIFAWPNLERPFYAYKFGYGKDNSRLDVRYETPDASYTPAYAAVPNPDTTPHRYRIYWNPSLHTAYLPDLNVALPPDYLCFAYSVNEGVTWTSLYVVQRDPPFHFTSAYGGIFLNKYSAGSTTAQADFAYFQAQQFDDVDWQVPDRPGNNQDRVGFEDDYGVTNQSGPPRFDKLGTTDSLTLRDKLIALEDAYSFPATAGKDPRFDLSERRADYPFAKPRLGLEERLFVQLDNTDYIKTKNDADGRQLLGDSAVRHVLLYDATQDPWHAHGAGHYGAGRDGKLYYDGVECGPGTFGTVAGGINRPAWAARDGYLEFPFGTTSPTITVDNEITCTVTPTTDACGLDSCLRWFLTGDFDLQVDYEIISTGAGPTDNGIVLMAAMDFNNEFYVRRKMWTSNLYDKDVKNNGSWVSYTSVATSDTTGKLRLVRVGSLVSSYYWNGSAWVQIGSSYTMTYLRPVFVQAYLQQSGGTAITAVVKIRNFTINSGATTNLIGWAREAAGTYRGSRADFPTHALIVSSGVSLDIIDADTDKLWMSFRQATNNVLHGYSSTTPFIRSVVMRDGVLLIAYRSPDTQAAEGGLIWIDFTLDWIRTCRDVGSSTTGGHYNVELSTSVRPRDYSNGVIMSRNAGRNLWGDYANWQVQSNKIHWADLLHHGGFQYRLIATNGGITLQRWTRWKLEGSSYAHIDTPNYATSTETGTMRWVQFRPISRDMLYHDRTKLYIVHAATWGLVIGGGGGTWVEDHAYTLAGTRDVYEAATLAQDQMTLDDTADYVLYARDEGVYRLNLTTGVSTLHYGKVGSGATVEVLPDYVSVTSVRLVMDGTTPLLLVGMTRPDRVWAINYTTNALYWKGFMDDGHQPFAMTVGA